MKGYFFYSVVLFCFVFSISAQEKTDSEEYSVYKTVLKKSFIKPDTKQLVIRKLTLDDSGKFYERGNMPLLEQEMIENYIAVNQKQVELKDDFGLDITVSLLTEEEMRSIFDSDDTNKTFQEALEKKYNTSGVIWLSRIGFNKDKTQAIVHVGYRCGPLCGQGGIVFLKKKEGIWSVVDSRPTWIS